MVDFGNIRKPVFFALLRPAGCIPSIPDISGIFCVWSILRLKVFEFWMRRLGLFLYVVVASLASPASPASLP